MPEDVNITINARTRRAIRNIDEVGDELLETAAKSEIAEQTTSDLGDTIDNTFDARKFADFFDDVDDAVDKGITSFTDYQNEIEETQKQLETFDLRQFPFFDERSQKSFVDFNQQEAEQRAQQSVRAARDDRYDMPDMDGVLNQFDQLERQAQTVRETEQKLGQVTHEAERELKQEADTLNEAADGALSLAEMKDIAKNSNRHLAKSAGVTQEAMKEKAQSLLRSREALNNLSNDVQRAIKGQEGLQNSILGTTQNSTKFSETLREQRELLRGASDEVKNLIKNRDGLDDGFQGFDASGFFEEMDEIEDKADKVFDSQFQGFDASGFFEEMDEIEDKADKVIHQQGVLGSVGEGTIKTLDKEAEEFAKASEEGVGLAQAKQLATSGNKALAKAAGFTKEKVKEEAESKIRDAVASRRMKEAVENASNETRKLGRSMAMSSAIGQGFNQSLYSTAIAADSAEDNVEELNDEVESLSFSSLAASINIGPLSFRLDQLAIQIPQLLILFGGLTTALAGVTAAAIGAAGAFASVFGAGLLAMGEQVEQRSSEVESSLQGIQEVLSSFAENQLREAIEPIMNPQTVNMTRRALAGVAAAVGIMASALSRIQGTLSGFQSNIGDIFFGNFNEVMREANRLLVDMLPFLEAITRYIMRSLPDAFNFLRKQGNRVLPVLGSFTKTLINTLVAFSELGITLFNAVLPVLEVFLGMIQYVADAFNALPDAITESGIMILAAIILLRRAVNFFDELLDRLERSSGYFTDLASDIFDFTKSMIAGERSLSKFNDELAEFIEMRRESLPEEESTRFYDATENAQDGGVLEALQDVAFIDRLYKFSQGSSLIAQGLRAIGTAAKPIVGVFGTLATVVATIATAIYFLRDGLSIAITRFAEILNLTGKSDGIFSDLGETFHLIGQFVNGFVEALTAVGQTLINIFSIGAIKNFEILAGILDFILNDIGPVNEIVAGFEMGLETLNGLLRSMLEMLRSVGEEAGNLLEADANRLESRVNRIIKNINRAIKAYNKLLKSPFGKGYRMAGFDPIDPVAEQDFRSQDFNRDERQTSTGTDVEMNFKEDVTNNTTVDARPEDKERFRKLVDDALEEANTFRRKQQGYSG